MTSKVARVYVNDVEVGAVPAPAYNKIVEEVHSDWRLYAAQGLNYAHVIYRILANTLKLWPVALCILLALCEVFEHASMDESIARLRAATPAQVDYVISLWLGISLAASTGFVAGRSLLLNRLQGLVDRFDEAIGRRVRALLQEPAQGTLRVVVESDPRDGQ